jgi:hypothetical protein
LRTLIISLDFIFSCDIIKEKGFKMSYEATERYRRTKKGVLTNIYSHIVYRSKIKGFIDPDFDKEYLHNIFLEDGKFNRIYNDWVKSGYLKNTKPSIDRISNKKPYLKNNIQMLSWAENRFKQSMERRSRKGQVCQILNGKIINTFKSQREAWKNLGVEQAMLSMALNGKCKTAYGYEWKYKNEIIGNIHEK